MESSSSEFSSLDLGEFDWALLSKEWNIKSQPYLQIPKLVACERKFEESAGKYYSDNDIVKSSTDAAKSSLKKFKQAVLDKCQSSFGTFYQSCFDELLGFNADVKSDATIEDNSLPEEKEKSRRIAKITGEIERRAKQPGCLNKFVVFNEPKRSREGRFCQCSETEKLTGIHHDIYPGETAIPHCVRDSNNLDKLTHYVLKVTKLSNNSAQPSTYFEVKDEIYYFEGFSLFLRQAYPRRFPTTVLNYLYDDYVWELAEEPAPTNFTVEELEAFHDYFFGNILELFDLNRFAANLTLEDSCPFYHCMPRFVTKRNNGERAMLSMCEVLRCLRKKFVPASTNMENNFKLSGQILLNPEKRPKAIRIDESQEISTEWVKYVHYGSLPKALENYSGIAKHVEKNRERFRTSKLSDFFFSEFIPDNNFRQTGLFPDLTVHALHLISAVSHIRIRCSISHFEKTVLGCTLNEPITFELALMHPSFRGSYGTNVSHCRTAWVNCGYGYPSSTPSKIIKRRGFETLQEAMEVLIPKEGTENVNKKDFVFDHERLEFLGDAVIGFITATRLFLMYPDCDEGFLATCRSNLVRNETLAFLGKKLGLPNYLLYGHNSSESTSQMDMDHAIANAFEAVMGALYLDQGIQFVDEFLGKLMFDGCLEAVEKWSKPQEYILKRDYPEGDRHLINRIDFLKKLTELEDSIGIYFRHIRILARVFVKSQDGDNYLTLGNYETLEFLGDSVLQLAVTVKLYLMYPFHNEGNLSLLRSCLVSNHTQSVIFDDLGFEKFITEPATRQQSESYEGRKRRADVMEAFIGALYIDQGLEICCAFCDICYFPRLKRFIIAQTWNDPKSLLQQCCLFLRAEIDDKPQVPTYKPLQQLGSSLNRQYEVGVYISGNRLATGYGPNMKQAEMDAALEALMTHDDLFPLSTIARSYFKMKKEEHTSNARNNPKKNVGE